MSVAERQTISGWYNRPIMESFTLLPRAEFFKLGAQALDDLPPYFQAEMSNVEIVIKAWPTRDCLQKSPSRLL